MTRKGRKKDEPNVFGITKEWKTSSEITTDPRGLKFKVREYNNHFGEDEDHQYYIVSGSYGYRLTQDRLEISDSINKEYVLAHTRLGQAAQRRKCAEDFFSKNERLPI